MSHELTPHRCGFDWGPAKVTRLFDDKKHGVWIQIAGKRESVDVRITKGGNVRVFSIKKQAAAR